MITKINQDFHAAPSAGRSRSNESGFTLLEVLVAVAVFAIGLLGIAGLQVAGMRYTQSAALRTDAVMQAENAADRMRANIEGVFDTTTPYNRADGSMPSSAPNDCTANPCTPVELAAFDLVAWDTSNGVRLPGGDGIVCVDSTPMDGAPGAWACDDTGEMYVIKVAWDERLSGADDEDTSGADDGVVTRTIYMRFQP